MDDYRAFPNVTEAAAMLGVSAATLSRRKPTAIEFGGRDHRLSAAEVMRQAEHFKRRPLSAVASELVQHAHRRAPDLVNAIDQELSRILIARDSKPAVGDEFLIEAERVLPRRLFLQVRKYYDATARPHEMGAAPLMPAQAEGTRKLGLRRTSVRASAARVPGIQKA